MSEVVQSEPTRVPRQWLAAIGVFMIVGVLLVMPVHYPGRLLGALFDFAHLPVFALLVYFVTRFVAGVQPSWAVAGTIAITAAVFGLCAEVVQGATGRSASLGDAMSNAIGSAAGFVVATRSRWNRLAFGAAVALLIAAMVFVYMYPISVVRDIVRQRNAFPMLASFEDDLELSRWTVRRGSFTRSQKFATDGEYCVEWNLRPGQYPRCTLRWPPQDWRDREFFEFDVWNESDEPLSLVVKIEDFTHDGQASDRYQQSNRLVQGRTTVRVDLNEVRTAPQGREMDMTLISRVQLFTIDLEQPRVLYLDRFWLTQ